ncbi:hybrid sensor histidine kinase/response regulator, partial [Candidatus Venteria ishoeyi]
ALDVELTEETLPELDDLGLDEADSLADLEELEETETLQAEPVIEQDAALDVELTEETLPELDDLGLDELDEADSLPEFDELDLGEEESLADLGELDLAEDEALPDLETTDESNVETIAEIAEASDIDIFAALSDVLVSTADILSTSLSTLVQAESGSDSQLSALEQYTEALQLFWSAAEAAEHAGLNSICAFINENVMAFSMLEADERQSTQNLLEAWPAVVLDYLLDPDEQKEHLISHLKSPAWSIPLTEEQVNDLNSNLAAPLQTTATPQSNGQLQAVIASLADISAPLSSALADILSAEDESETLLEAVSNYAETMQPFMDAVDAAELSGLQEICTILSNNVLALGMLPLEERQAAEDIFNNWPNVLQAYLDAPEANTAAVLENLQNEHWPTPLPMEQSLELYDQLLQVETGADNAPALDTLTDDLGDELPEFDEFLPAEEAVATGNIPESVVNSITAALTDAAIPLSNALENIVSMDNSNDVFFEALETYTTHLQDILDAAEQAGLVGLQEVCSFINDNLLALSAEDQAVRSAAQTQLETWPGLVLDYLTAPQENAAALAAHLQASQWPNPLTAEQVADLSGQLLQGASTESLPELDDDLGLGEELPEIEEELPALDELDELDETPDTEAEDVEGAAPEGEISLGNTEMLAMLQGEIEDSKEDLNENLQKFCQTDSSDPEFANIAENYTDLVQRLADAADMMGLPGLQQVCELIIDNAKQLAEKDQAARASSQSVLAQWPDLVIAYLQAPTDNVINLLNHLRESEWPAPLPDEQAHQLLNNLSQSSGMEEEEPEPSRETQAKPEDVNISPPADVNQDLLDAFLEEAPINAAEFTAALQRIVKNPVPEDVKLGQRVAHTLKGSANIIGIKGIASVAHHLEDILEYLAENAVPPPKPLTDTMIEAADTLEIMIDALLGKEEPPENAVTVLQEVLDWANRIDQGQLDVSEEELAKRKAELEKAASAAPVAAKPAAAGAGAAAPAGEAEQTLRVPTRTIDNLLRLVGEMSISIGQIQERLGQAMQNTKNLNSQEMQVQQKSYDLETLVDVQDISGRQRHRQIGDDADKEVDTEEEQASDDGDFDSLEFEQYNELHSLTHSFIETIADSRELGSTILDDLSSLDGMFIQQERLQKELQQVVMTTRMVPIKNITARLERIIRQTCRATDKQAEFSIIGGDILMDGDVLTKLTDPLMHILRNSVDHGMETPDERIAAGKQEGGSVVLNCFRQGNSIVVRCEDDGKGLNFEKIRGLAVERELIKETQELSPKELGRLIFIPGFTTKGGVTQISGRGVGMDVVHTSIKDLKGSVDIDSVPGKGTMISLTLPMSLVTEHALLIKVGKERFALPTSYLSQALASDAGKFKKVGNEISFHMEKNAYPVITLAELLHMPNVQPVTLTDERSLVLVEEEGKTTAVIVDALLDSRDLVSKTMGRYVQNVKGIAGASILGDGSVVALLDLPSLLRSPAKSISLSMSSSAGAEAADDIGIPHIMIVDDSLSVRKSLSQLVEDQGYETLLAKDGLEAIEMMGKTRPNVMLVDMEMPRMNGIELTAHVRANAATNDIPICMITSRTTEKHRTLAKDAGVSEYLTKPYQETDLLQFINASLKK